MAQVSNKTFANISYDLNYTYIDEVDDECICSICSLPLVEPLLHTTCEQMFCSKCVENLNSCPKCNPPPSAKEHDEAITNDEASETLVTIPFETRPAPKSIKNFLDK